MGAGEEQRGTEAAPAPLTVRLAGFLCGALDLREAGAPTGEDELELLGMVSDGWGDGGARWVDR